MERIVLMGGPCSGQIHDIADDQHHVRGIDASGAPQRYTRTRLTDTSDERPVTIFRPVPPERPLRRGEAEWRLAQVRRRRRRRAGSLVRALF